MARTVHAQPVRVRLRLKLGAYPPAGRFIHQAIFAKALPRVAVRRVRRSEHPGAPALARAVEGIRGRGIDAGEAQWIDRIEERRAEFGAREAPIRSGTQTGGRTRLPPRHFSGVASIHRPWGVFLQRLVRELRPRSCVELGTAIGISAAYQGSGLALNADGRLRTIEGAPWLAELARETLAELEIDRVEVIDGRFDDVLDAVLADAAPIDFAYMDAGKDREQNVVQFERLLPHLAPGAAFVIDDVHWSREMNGAWREIRAHPQVGLSVDLWRLGACLMRT